MRALGGHRPPLQLDLEKLFRVVFEDHLLFSSTQEFEAFDNMARLVKPLSCFRIFYRADTQPLRAEQATANSDGSAPQSQRVYQVQNRVVVEVPHLIRKPQTATT